MIDLDEENLSATEVNLTPMIDCVFLLLIFFLVASTLKKTQQQISVELPAASSAVTQPSLPRSLTITINSSGEILMDGKPVPSEKLLDEVRQLTEGQTDIPVRIEADRQTPYENVLRVLDLLKMGGVRQVGLTTQLPENSAAD
jgi:biopolymer transport protein ExbD